MKPKLIYLVNKLFGFFIVFDTQLFRSVKDYMGQSTKETIKQSFYLLDLITISIVSVKLAQIQAPLGRLFHGTYNK